MSTSTGKTISLPTINEVEGYKTTEDLINFLRDQDIGLEDKHFNILREQEIDGLAFLRLNADKLMNYDKFSEFVLRFIQENSTATVVEEMKNAYQLSQGQGKETDTGLSKLINFTNEEEEI
ncbi:12232_t:CDS:2, partial [Ambispora leptoticha]